MTTALIAMESDAGWQSPPGVELRFCATDGASIEAALDEKVEILLTDELPPGAERASGLRWLQLFSSGTDQLFGHPLIRRDIRLSNAAGTSAAHMAEFILARLLYHTKQLRAFEQLQQQHVWPDRIGMSRPSLRGKTALVIGYGGVGRETARLFNVLGMRIIAVTRDGNRASYRGYASHPDFGDPEATLPERVVAPDRLHEVLPPADVIVVAAPLTAATKHMINAAALAHTKPEAILINIARGGVVDTAALVDALDSGRLAHAYLDVHEQEPLPASSPLWDHPAISITPHMSGVMPDPVPALRDLFLQNLERFRDGRRLINQLEPQTFR